MRSLPVVFWQGISVGHIKRVDNRLRVELARVYAQDVQPGTKVAIQTRGDSQNLFVCGPEEIQQLQDLRREALERMEKGKVALPLPDR